MTSRNFSPQQLPGKRGDGPKGWAIQAKLDVVIWLGLHKHKKDYLKDAPKGYQTVMDAICISKIGSSVR